MGAKFSVSGRLHHVSFGLDLGSYGNGVLSVLESEYNGRPGDTLDG